MRRQYDFAKLRRVEPNYLRRLKKPVTMRLDPQVLLYFRRLAERTGIPYQSLINYVLTDYATHELQPSAQWERSGHVKARRAG
ncbi:MAG: BrnA antitoxin family protein [Deltaproteobacteria bacterium]|nr:BrnA antitoxin family protein [Deltaproteobacteria bacterium]